MANPKRPKDSKSIPPPAETAGAFAAERPGDPRVSLLCVALILAIWVAYWGVLSSDFITYDDREYISDNPMVRKGLSAQSATWAFTTTYFANWHPVTWLSHMLDVQLFGLHAGRHHGVNLLFHTLNALLLLLLIESLTGSLWRSAFVAALFALHPLHVESVAWVAERKDVLSTLFWLLTFAAWVAFLRSRRPAWYVASLLLFALGLMAKPMLVTLPFTLLLLDYWPLGRLNLAPGKTRGSLRGLLLEKLPFLVLSAASCAVTVVAQHIGGAVVTMRGVSLVGRVSNAAWAYGAYLLKTIWPSSLAIFYPLSPQGHPPWQVALAVVLLLALTAMSLGWWRRAPFVLFGWLWFLGTLVPVIGIVQVGSQAMADRYTYVPLIGIFIMAAWGLGALADRGSPFRIGVACACFSVLMALLAVARIQVSHWANSRALYEHALAVTSDNYLVHNNLGATLVLAGKDAEALPHFREALRILPEYPDAQDNLGHALEKVGKHTEAVEHFQLAVRYGSRRPEVLVNLGNILMEEGRGDEALECYRRAVRTNPDFPGGHSSLGLALWNRGQFSGAREEFEASVRLQPGDAEALHMLGRSLASLGKMDEAVRRYQEALALNPDFPECRNDLGTALYGMGRFDDAASQYGEAIRVDPEYAEAHNNLGLALGSLGRLLEAMGEFREAIRCRPAYAEAHNNLGLALARDNRGPEALEQFREALRIQPDFAGARANLDRMEAALSGRSNP